jgi:hypothetical protein
VSASVGADVESICSKCGDVWHVVVAKVGDQIVKVLCKQCGGQHRYRPPGVVPKPTRAAAAASAEKPRARPKPMAEEARPEPTVTFDPHARPRPYRPTELYGVGERLLHPVFGIGVVEVANVPGKMKVCFPTGRRVLAHAKAASSLERPSAQAPGEDQGKGS